MQKYITPLCLAVMLVGCLASMFSPAVLQEVNGQMVEVGKVHAYKFAADIIFTIGIVGYLLSIYRSFRADLD